MTYNVQLISRKKAQLEAWLKINAVVATCCMMKLKDLEVDAVGDVYRRSSSRRSNRRT